MEEELEQEQQETNRVHRPYKVMEGDLINVRRKDIVGRNGQPYIFYFVNLSEKMKDEEKRYFPKEVYFKKGVTLLDNTKIKVLNFFEKVRPNNQDKYHPIWGIFITEFEVIEEPNYYEEQDNIESYQGLSESEESNIGLIDPSW
jgi:hypothetical protein